MMMNTMSMSGCEDMATPSSPVESEDEGEIETAWHESRRDEAGQPPRRGVKVRAVEEGVPIPQDRRHLHSDPILEALLGVELELRRRVPPGRIRDPGPREGHHRPHGAIRLLVDRRDAHLLCGAGLYRPYLFGHPGGDDDDCDEVLVFSVSCFRLCAYARVLLGPNLCAVLSRPSLML